MVDANLSWNLHLGESLVWAVIQRLGGMEFARWYLIVFESRNLWGLCHWINVLLLSSRFFVLSFCRSFAKLLYSVSASKHDFEPYPSGFETRLSIADCIMRLTPMLAASQKLLHRKIPSNADHAISKIGHAFSTEETDAMVSKSTRGKFSSLLFQPMSCPHSNDVYLHLWGPALSAQTFHKRTRLQLVLHRFDRPTDLAMSILCIQVQLARWINDWQHFSRALDGVWIINNQVSDSFPFKTKDESIDCCLPTNKVRSWEMTWAEQPYTYNYNLPLLQDSFTPRTSKSWLSLEL